MASEETFFELPSSPDAFSVVLPSADLRRIDFSGLDYPTSRRALIEYIRTYFPDDFNDFIASNGIMMLIEILSAITAKLSLRSDLLAVDYSLPTAQSEEAVVNHLALINQRIKRQTPSVVDIEITIEQPTQTDVEIDPGELFSIDGPDGERVDYEVYRAPGDFTSKIIIPAGKRGVIAYGIQGAFATPFTATSAGGANQRIVITNENILESPIFVTVTTGSDVEDWIVTTDPIERYSSTDKVVEVSFANNDAIFRFGDNNTGAALLPGQVVTITYRVGGGSRGRIGVGQIDDTRSVLPQPPANASIPVRFRNISPSVGGTNKETIQQAKQRAPRDFATQGSIVTDGDYAQVAQSFSHPAFGSISKAVATVRTSRNANLVEVYALAVGPDDLPVAPSVGLKLGLQTYISNLNVATDHVEILDGVLKPININMAVVMSRNADATVIKNKVENAITDFFDLANWEMGRPLYVSKLNEVVKSIDGVQYVNIYEPLVNVLQTGQLSDPDSAGVGINELIIEGSRTINYYYERV